MTRHAFQGSGSRHHPDVEAQLRAEIAWLRAELSVMADCGEHPCAFCFEMAQRAKRALETKP